MGKVVGVGLGGKRGDYNMYGDSYGDRNSNRSSNG